MNTLLAVGLGGIAGALARYFISIFIQKFVRTAFPYGTLTVNISGCFIMGFIIDIFIMNPGFSPSLKLFFITGFAGAFTTFSTFGHETVSLFISGNFKTAFFNILLTNLIGLSAVFAGAAAARIFIAVN